jgi:hypothetical protein
MTPVIVYVDDAAHAQQLLAPFLARETPGQYHWILVACAPRMTHRISKWVSHSARENWRAKWADKLFTEMAPWLQSHGGQHSTVLAKGPLDELSEKLQTTHGRAQVIDARRPKLETVTATQPTRSGWSLPNTLASFGALFMLVAAE